ncbi:MAG: hypothetical protein WC807_16560 [Hyphomicrobium sp.]|jgi:hypothetical protein
MQLTHHAYSHKSDRFFIDGSRVSKDCFELARIKGRISGHHHCCFITRQRSTAPGATHHVHYFTISERT